MLKPVVEPVVYALRVLTRRVVLTAVVAAASKVHWTAVVVAHYKAVRAVVELIVAQLALYHSYPLFRLSQAVPGLRSCHLRTHRSNTRWSLVRNKMPPFHISCISLAFNHLLD